MNTEQSIIENNKLIAGFMGVESHEGMTGLVGIKDNQLLGTIMYDTSWDWLMPVVEKIESLKSPNGFYYDIDILSTGIVISDVNNHVVQVTQEEIQSTSKIAAVYYAIVKFIEWNNQNN